MRIAQVIPYVSHDGAFGGPLSVAVAQSTELARRGHDVHVYAGWDGKAHFDPDVREVHLFRARQVIPIGLSGLLAPGLPIAVNKAARQYDVMHVHGGRDLSSMAVYASVSRRHLVIQPHGMIANGGALRNRIADRALVRNVLNQATSVLALTPEEATTLRGIAADARVTLIHNGIAPGPLIRPPDDDDEPEVLFLARLHPRKNVLLFAEAARSLIFGGTRARFTVVGPDEGDGTRLRSFISSNNLNGRLTYEGAIPPGTAQERLSRATVYVLPSDGEVYPMSVLEALSVGTPTILSRTCAIASDLANEGAVRLTDPTAHDIALQTRHLLEDIQTRKDLRSAGFRLIDSTLSIRAVAARLEDVYNSSPIGPHKSPRTP